MFNFLFNKINQSSTSAKASKDPNIKSTTTLEESISNIENILQIKSPKLQKVACLYDEGGLVQCQFELAPNTLPTNAHYYAAYYLDDADIIYFSAYRIKSDHNKNSISFVELSIGDILFTLAHELKHVWQKEYEYDKYYKKNAIGNEVINDPAEIDADAFAVAYLCSSNSSYSYKDFPFNLEQMHIQGTLDNGKRWSRAEQLSDQFGFDSRENIIAAKTALI